MQFNGIDFDTYLKNYPDKKGYFGKYGGSYIAPELQAAMNEITEAYFTICKSRKFTAENSRAVPPPSPIWIGCLASWATYSCM